MTRPAIRAVRYLRVSTSAQADDKRYGYARQRIICTRSEAKHGLEVVGEVTDQISGGESLRPGLASLPEVARQHGATAISLSEVDRLSRDIPGGYAIIGELINTKLDIYSSDLQRRVNFRDVDSVKEVNDRLRDAHMERSRTRHRTYTGLLAKAADGLTVRPLELFGYLKGVPFERQALWVRRCFELGLDYGGVAIADMLIAEGAPAPGRTPWNAEKVHDMLTNATYKGEAGYGRELFCPVCLEARQGHRREARRGSATCQRCGGPMTVNRISIAVPPLVTPELYDAVQEARQGRARFYGARGKRQGIFPLTGRIACGTCGRAMNGTGRNGRYYYVCTSGRRPGGERCSHRRHYRAEAVHEIVIRELHHLAEHPGALETALIAAQTDPQQAERTRVEAARAELSAKLTLIEDGYLSGAVSLERALQERRETEAKLRALPTLRPVVKRRVEAGELRQRIANGLAERPLSEVVQLAGARVLVADGLIHVAIH
jgi:DNA invertase Pin-like site-specific DNA recombinase